MYVGQSTLHSDVGRCRDANVKVHEKDRNAVKHDLDSRHLAHRRRPMHTHIRKGMFCFEPCHHNAVVVPKLHILWATGKLHFNEEKVPLQCIKRPLCAPVNAASNTAFCTCREDKTPFTLCSTCALYTSHFTIVIRYGMVTVRNAGYLWLIGLRHNGVCQQLWRRGRCKMADSLAPKPPSFHKAKQKKKLSSKTRK